MFIISYNLSSSLTANLAKIDQLRKKILVIPVSPHTDTQLRWACTLAHITGWALLSNQPLPPLRIDHLIETKNTLSPIALDNKVIRYKKSLNHILQNWTANPESVTVQEINNLSKMLSVSHSSDKETTTLLTYLQTGDVHPVIQSAMAHLYFYPNRLCYLTSLLFLAKYGYDLRGWLSLEDYWHKHKDLYLQTIQSASKTSSVTLWLEFYSQAIITQLEKLVTQLALPTHKTDHQAITALTTRQKTLLDLLSEPNKTLTNKQVQTFCSISQITASRDLAKLTSLNLIFPHAGGRSTYYTRT